MGRIWNAKEFFIYQVPTSGAIAAAASARQSVSINADAPFLFRYLSSPLALANVLIEIQDTDGFNYQSAPVPLQVYATNVGAQDRPLPVNRTVPANTTLTFTFYNLTGAPIAAPGIYLSMVGYKVKGAGAGKAQAGQQVK